tara:strand:- start:2420 stop:3121 length:702 start_codon:yes stop_codon:yes gene_type:complete
MHNIKIFYDGVDLDFISKNRSKIIDGVTTNPTLMKKAGIENFESYSRNLIEILPDKPISLEVFSDEINEMKDQALKINSWGENLFVKIPITNSEGESTKNLISELLKDGVKLNITAIFTLEQIIHIAECFEETSNNILSVFCGRIADTGVDPEMILKEIVDFKNKNALTVDLLWASAREVYNLKQAENSKCQIITLSQDLIEKIEKFGKDLNEYSIDTVKMFKNDAEDVGYTI